MTKQPLNNPSSQAEKQQVLRDEQRLRAGDRAGTTYHSLAGVDAALENTGRFSSRATIAGEEPAVHYPAASGPWADPVRVPDEPSLGYAIDQQEVTGEAAEIAHSLSQFAGCEGSAGLPTFTSEMSETTPSTSHPAIPAPAAMMLGAAEPTLPSAPLPVPGDVQRGSVEAHAKLKALLSKGLRRRRL
jgi:hypothetical protein